MGHRFLYGDEHSTQGWEKCKEYNSKNIEKDIRDSNINSGDVKNPRTAVPSPFARFELVQKAFENVAMMGKFADDRDIRLVSHSLDLLQLFYEQGENIEDGINGFSVVKWSKYEQLELLRNSGHKGHKLLGSAFELYMRQENYGFDEKQYVSEDGIPANDVVISIITYKGVPLGCTSPTSIFMATPDSSANNSRLQTEIKIDGNKSFLGEGKFLKDLHERDVEFVKYVYRLMACIKYKDAGSNPLSSFMKYLNKQKEEINSNDSDLYNEIGKIEGNEDIDMTDYYQLSSSFSVLGYGLYYRKAEEAAEQIKRESDFVINSEKSDTKPLVLTNNCTATNWAYTSRSNVWNLSRAKINYAAKESRSGKRTKLPGGQFEYKHGWLCENDFLSDVLIKLPYTLDDANFWSRYNEGCSGNYLLPIKEEFFKYFDYSYLKGENNGKYIFRLKEKKDGTGKVTCVIANLDIRVKGGKFLTLEKIYNATKNKSEDLCTVSAEEDHAVGYMVECPVALNIMPFVKLENNNLYHIQLIKRGNVWEGFDLELHLMQTGPKGDTELEMNSDVVKRSKDTSYYKLSKSEAFDYFRINVTNATQYHNHSSVLIPLWEEKSNGTTKYDFSFDFGTSNSHISVKKEGEIGCMDFCLRKSHVSTMKNPEEHTGVIMIERLQAPVIQEFLPYRIGSEYAYSFPLRTVVSSPKTIKFNHLTPSALCHVNIPFAYGKEDYNEALNEIHTNIKWGNNKKFAEAFIEEMVILARIFALENGGDLPECSFAWTYPLSMNGAVRRGLSDVWKKNYETYFGGKEEKVKAIPESIAPALYYDKEGKLSEQMTLSIDIGGGTCDVLIYESMNSIKITSFRFAADVIFGAIPSAKNNPMVGQYYREFVGMLETKKGTEELCKMLTNFCGENSKAESSEANSMLFSLESNPMLSKVNTEDKSYNTKLGRDSERKIIFVYFYAAIVCYLAKLMVSQHLPKPEQILFSGTGSKLLNIIGDKTILEEFTTKMLEIFSDGNYSYSHSVTVELETVKPKQLTAEGALFSKDDKRRETITNTVHKPKENIVCYSMIKDTPVLTYDQLDNKKEAIYKDIVEACKDFNKQFITFVNDMDLVDEYGYSRDSIEMLKKHMDWKLLAHLKTEIAKIGQEEKRDTKTNEMEDTLFFHALKGVIADFISNVKK